MLYISIDLVVVDKYKKRNQLIRLKITTFHFLNIKCQLTVGMMDCNRVGRFFVCRCVKPFILIKRFLLLEFTIFK